MPYNLIRGVKYASTDYLKAQLYKILSDPSGDVSIWQKTALRLDRLEHSTNVMVRKNLTLYMIPNQNIKDMSQGIMDQNLKQEDRETKIIMAKNRN